MCLPCSGSTSHNIDSWVSTSRWTVKSAWVRATASWRHPAPSTWTTTGSRSSSTRPPRQRTRSSPRRESARARPSVSIGTELGCTDSVPRGQEAEHHAVGDAGARAEVVPAHDGRRDVAGRVEAADRLVVPADDARVLVGHEPATRADVTGHDLDGVEGRFVDRAKARVHLAVGVPEAAVVRRLATAVVRVFPARRELVETLDGLGEPGGVDAAQTGQVGERPGLLEPSALQQIAGEPARV